MQLWCSSLRLQLMAMDALSMMTFHLADCYKVIAIAQFTAVSLTLKLVEIRG